MMQQLLWKEWQERRIWLLLWALAEVGCGVFAHVQSPFGMQQFISQWFLLPTALALLAGLGAYGSELSGGRATFLYSRALCWKQVLFSKVLLGLAVLVGAPLITAVILRLSTPSPYVPFMTPANLLFGMLMVILQTGIAFFIGLGCSIVLAGLAGSILVLLGYMGIFFLAMTYFESKLQTPYIFMICFFCALLLATIITARFGITLSPGLRLRRFALILLVPIIAGFLTEETPPIRRFIDPTAQPVGSISGFITSPSEDYAFVDWSGKDSVQHEYWFDVATQHFLPLPSNQYFSAWTSNECLLTKTFYRNQVAHPDNCTLTWLKNGQIRSYHFTTGQVDRPLSSPDGAKVLLPMFLSTGMNLIVYDVRTDKMQSIPVSWPKKYWRNSNYPDQCWWQTADVVGYISPLTGKRVLVKLTI